MNLHKRNKLGFTLAELLIVVAIIAVLVAIAIPVFTKRLEASRETTDIANLRSAYAAAQVTLLQDAKSISNKKMAYDPNNEIGLVADGSGIKLGKGTSVDGGADTTGLPKGITYKTDGTNGQVAGKEIKVEFDAAGTAASKIVSIQFG